MAEASIRSSFQRLPYFFDTIDINILLEQALYSEYPTTSICLAMQQHLAPRVIQVSGFASEPVSITHSILAGCQQSVALTRALLNKNMSKLAKEHPDAPPCVFVDDTAMVCSFPKWSQVQNTLAACLIQFAKCVRRLNLSLSPKAVLAVSDFKLGKSLQKELELHGIFFNIASRQGARDLGVSHSAGTSRPATILVNRKTKIIQRKNRINNIAKISRRAKILYTGSALPAETWGHQASGLSPSHILAIERDAIRCTGIGTGYCRTIALRVFYGPYTTPYARIIKELVISWFRVYKLNMCGIPIINISKAWHIALNKIVAFPTNTNNIRGIMTNIINMLLTLNWKPTHFNEWTDRNGEKWKLCLDESPRDLIRQLISDFNDRELIKASSFRSAIGIEGNICWPFTLALHNKTNIDYSQKSALETILCGACWPNDRINSCYGDIPSTCTRCGHPKDDEFHMFWECPFTLAIKDENVSTTNHLARAAKDGLGTAACMWLRGLLPLSLASIEALEEFPGQWAAPSIIEPIYEEYDCSNSVFKSVTSGTYYGDASGGDFSSMPMLRRCGVGIMHTVTVGNEIHRIWGCSFKLIGNIQTVPRAELSALHFILNEAVENAKIEFITDNLQNCKLFNKGKDACLHVANNDLFKSIFHNIQTKNIDINVRWMPSHLSNKVEDPLFVLPDNVTFCDIKGNQWADDLCGKASKNAKVPMHISTPIIYYKNLILRIQRRLVAVICAMPNRNKHNIVSHKSPIPHDSISTLIDNSEHVVFEANGRITCVRCAISLSLKSQSIQHWLKGKCISIGSADDRPIPLFHATVHIKNQSIHDSHKIYKFKDLYYCNICGAHGRSSTKIQKLAKNCEPRTFAGNRFLNNAQKGIFPFGYHYSILPQEHSACLNKFMTSHSKLVQEIQSFSPASMPVPVSPPVSPLSLPYSPESPRLEEEIPVLLEPPILAIDSDSD